MRENLIIYKINGKHTKDVPAGCWGGQDEFIIVAPHINACLEGILQQHPGFVVESVNILKKDIKKMIVVSRDDKPYTEVKI